MALELRPLEDKASEHLEVLLISPAKYGKTTSLATLPKPLLLADVDGGIDSLFKEKQVPPGLREGIVVCKPKTYGDVQEVLTTAWKEGPGGRPFASVAVDTLSWVMTHLVKPEILAMSHREKMELQDWGLYLERGLKLARLAHDLATRPDGCHVVLTTHEADKGGGEGEIAKLGPSVQGQLFDILPGIPPFVFFLRVLNRGLDPKTRTVIMERVFQTEADQRTPAGSRRALEKYEKPDFAAIWEKVRPGAGGTGGAK